MKATPSVHHTCINKWNTLSILTVSRSKSETSKPKVSSDLTVFSKDRSTKKVITLGYSSLELQPRKGMQYFALTIKLRFLYFDDYRDSQQISKYSGRI